MKLLSSTFYDILDWNLLTHVDCKLTSNIDSIKCLLNVTKKQYDVTWDVLASDVTGPSEEHHLILYASFLGIRLRLDRHYSSEKSILSIFMHKLLSFIRLWNMTHIIRS